MRTVAVGTQKFTAPELTARVLAVGREAGLDAVGVAPATPFTRAREAIESRKREGLHGGMAFTYKNPARSTDPDAALEGAKAIVVGARSYRVAATSPRPARPTAVVARYAEHDHYKLLGDGLRAVAAELKSAGWKARVVVDDNALVDREAAYRAGLGWYGKSANILLPGKGSWFVLGSVVTDAPLVAADDAGRRRMWHVPAVHRRVPDRRHRRARRRRCAAMPRMARAVAGRVPDETLVSRSAIASTDATTAKRCARRTSSLDRRADDVQTAGAAASTSSTCSPRPTRRCSSATAAGTSPIARCGTCVATR